MCGCHSLLAAFFLVGVQIVDARDAIQIVERQGRLIAQIAADFEQAVRRDFDPRIDVLEVRAGDLVAELGLQLIDECGTGHARYLQVTSQ